MKGITLCADCAYYNMKKHKCTRGCKIDPDVSKGENPSFYVDCPLPDVEPLQKWIPCSERLPENNVPVLYVWRSQNGAVSVLHGWHFEIRSLGSAWHQSGMGMHRPDEEVTHWMPLPEPPKEDENE